MALLMEGMPKPRGRRNEDNLIGISGDIGMTDSSFQGMGRAPVDELWAGRYSAAIDDSEFLEAEKKARQVRAVALANKDWHIEKKVESGMSPIEAEMEWAEETRIKISDETGLDLYPGDLRGDEKNPIFMKEFSDQGAGFRHDGWDRLIKAIESGEGTRLGEVLQHPRLYEHYPEAQFMRVLADPSMDEGHYGGFADYRDYGDDIKEDMRELAPAGVMYLNPKYANSEESLETILHELQHFIQSAEGWEAGGSAGRELGEEYLDDQIGLLGDQVLGDFVAKRAQKMIDSQDGLFEFSRKNKAADRVAFEAYENLSGEELARNATDRRSSGGQIVNYYLGGEGVEQENWGNEQLAPLDTIPELRQEMQDAGILGPLTRKVMRGILDTGALPQADDQPHRGVKDPYLEALKEAVRESRR